MRDAIAGKKRELETTRLSFEWCHPSGATGAGRSRLYRLELARHVCAPAHAVAFNLLSAPLNPDGEVATVFATGAVAVRGQRLVTTFLARLLHVYGAVSAARRLEMECWLTQGDAPIFESLQPVDIEELGNDDPAADLAAAQWITEQPQIADALLFLCINGAV